LKGRGIERDLAYVDGELATVKTHKRLGYVGTDWYNDEEFQK
jgi:hypothetical protein